MIIQLRIRIDRTQTPMMCRAIMPAASTTPSTTLPTPPLAKSYTPGTAEVDVRARWEAANAFHADPNAPGEPFCILIPPPNVTGALHLGHAFNNTLQDVLVRYHRMRGSNTLWMPGTDHASISTQAVVERRLMLEGKRRTDFTREQFVEIVQAWKDEYETTIIEQLKAMGASCDFDRTRFTMDEVCTKAVREAFFRLFKDGLIYRGKRLVNWDPVSQTSLSDDEVEMEEVQGHMWYLRYPFVSDEATKRRSDEGKYVTVATTRPETMLGDTAVAMNPKDPRAAQFFGKHIKLPIVDRVIPIIADNYVVMPPQFGGDPNDPKAAIATGFLKVTPAHDPNDYEIRQRHPEIDMINVLAPDATISDKHGWSDVSAEARKLVGLSREDARKAVVKWFKDRGLLEDVKPYTHSVGHSYRSHAPIEPYLSDQWYVKVTDGVMRGEALRAMAADQRENPPPARSASEGQREGDNELRFFPARYAKTFESWHENLRDWCISRQLWWGHRIPVWTSGIANTQFLTKWLKQGKAVVDVTADGDAEDDSFSKTIETRVCVAPDCADLEAELAERGFEQDPDVLDTWFSSGLWPISTMGWPDAKAFPKEIPEGSALLNTFNPSDVLLTAREIITLWVSRMVMFNRYFRDGKLPFRHVYIHAMIQDGYGQKMSKSLGNGVDPRDIIHSHGADALRFIMTKLATSTQDVRLPVDMVCPHCDTAFHPKEITTPTGGYRVADVHQTCASCGKKMVSGYGAATGLAKPTKDIPLARNTSAKFDEGGRFANKIYNVALNFTVNALKPKQGAHTVQSADINLRTLSLADRWIVSRLHRTMHIVEDALADYQFNVYADAMYDFVWGDFCDWYIEAIKPTIRNNPAQQQVLRTVLNAIVRLLHPIMPFVTESLWPHIQAAGQAGLDGIKLPPSDLLATAAWPDIKCSVDDPEALATFERIQNLTNAIRTVRSERQVPPKKRIHLSAPPPIIALIKSAGGVVESLAGLESVTQAGAKQGGRSPSSTAAGRPGPSQSEVKGIPLAFEGAEILLTGLVDEVDVDTERARLTKLIAEKERAVIGFRNRLSNEGYLSKAPPEKVEETRQLLAQAEADLAAARKALESLA
ncbi:MAG: valine--tRNA ligase [Phycisphaerales bacterium]|nr:valine--tRNA ligase [Phycisphaerales bacterium]